MLPSVDGVSLPVAGAIVPPMRENCAGASVHRLGRATIRAPSRPEPSMADISHRSIETNNVNLHIAEAGEGPLVVLFVMAFPSPGIRGGIRFRCLPMPDSTWWHRTSGAMATAMHRRTSAPTPSFSSPATSSGWCMPWAKSRRWWWATTGALRWLGPSRRCGRTCSEPWFPSPFPSPGAAPGRPWSGCGSTSAIASSTRSTSRRRASPNTSCSTTSA